MRYLVSSCALVIKFHPLNGQFSWLDDFLAEVLNRPCPDFPQGKMIMQDRLEKERNDAKNNVEEYVYDMRDKLHGMLEKFVTESVSKHWLFFFKGERWLMCTIWADVTFVYFIWESWLELCVCAMQDRDALSLKLEDTENWLYEDGEDQPKQVYIDKLAELKVILPFTCVDLLRFLL